MSEKENKKDHMTGLVISMVGSMAITWFGGWEGGWLTFAAVCGFFAYWVADWVANK
jgi:hypothetical protein